MRYPFVPSAGWLRSTSEDRSDAAECRLTVYSWLPAPAGGGKLLYSIRFYSSAEAFTNGDYVFQTVEIISAIKA